MGNGGLGFSGFLFRWVFVLLGFSGLIISSNWFDGLCVWLCLRFDGLCLCFCVCVCGSVCVVMGLNRLISVSWVYMCVEGAFVC